MSYYNTTFEVNPQLAQHHASAKDQEQTILRMMRQNRGQVFTAEDIERVFCLPRTSVSRALRNLTMAGDIQKSSKARWKSKYGRSCHAWRVPA